VRTVLVVACTLLLCAALAALLVTFDDDGREQLFGITYDEYALERIYVVRKLEPSGEYIDRHSALDQATELTGAKPLHARLVQVRQEGDHVKEHVVLWAIDLNIRAAPDFSSPEAYGISQAVMFLDGLTGDVYTTYLHRDAPRDGR